MMTADQMDDIMTAISKFFKEQDAEEVVVYFEYGNAIDSICRVTDSTLR